MNLGELLQCCQYARRLYRHPDEVGCSTACIDMAVEVDWDGEFDPQNPKNWPSVKKWRMTLIVSCFALLSLLTSTMISLSTREIARSIDADDLLKVDLISSIFLLGIGFGPLVLGPISEINGRVRVLILGNLFFILWNTVSGFSHTVGQLTAFRLLSGFGGSAPLAIGGGLMSDLWQPEERGRALSIYTAGPLLGPAIGPIIGGYVTQHLSWRWIFWIVSIASSCFSILAISLLKETYAPKILSRKAKRLRLETGNTNLHTKYDDTDQTFYRLLKGNLVRPIKMISTQVIIQVLSLYMAVLYGIMYLVLFTFPILWTNTYRESVSTGSLNYISIGVGFTLGTHVGGRFNDWIYGKLKTRNHNVGTPEFRVALMVPGSVLLPIGLIWPNIGSAIFCMGTIMCFQGIQTYTIDAYPRYASSAISTLNVLRSLTGFAFPLFAPAMYDKLGNGVGNCILASVLIALAASVPALLWKYGSFLRKKSGYAAGDGN
ncbi:MFS multidrug transporter [Mollisia scopiformis]|uniref:MFS multidrug transporter n=1 Tax=Mollisia scopiformis TaxID=149040 RepID=A0A194XI49_MOLSC|nr:MFS multidrug transporter [Mollisia scopiformis]KUJ19900.1 MFS multidrug transporter [Mollisia scopiformis]